jgi:hypothetical protein
MGNHRHRNKHPPRLQTLSDKTRTQTTQHSQ